MSLKLDLRPSATSKQGNTRSRDNLKIIDITVKMINERHNKVIKSAKLCTVLAGVISGIAVTAGILAVKADVPLIAYFLLGLMFAITAWRVALLALKKCYTHFIVSEKLMSIARQSDSLEDFDRYARAWMEEVGVA